MKFEWSVDDIFPEEMEPKHMVGSAGGQLAVELYRKVCNSKWFVTCEVISLYRVPIEAENDIEATAKATCLIINKLHKIIALFRNMIFEINPWITGDGDIISKEAMKWTKFSKNNMNGLSPESGQEVLIEEGSGEVTTYSVGTYYREGDSLNDELPPSKDDDFIKNIIVGTSASSDRKAEESGFYKYEINPKTGLAQWSLICPTNDVVAWASLKPSSLNEEE